MKNSSRRPILVKGARENNLKNINVEIPAGEFTVITGLSGSGKSSLAADTVHAESTRKYIQCLSTYTRQFLDRVQRPDVDAIENLPPSISIENRNRVKNNRSTLGTTTEIYDYLRLLFASVGKTFCPRCGVRADEHSPQSMAKKLASAREGENGLILFQCAENETAARLLKKGYLRIFTLPEKIERIDEKTAVHSNCEVVIDRIKFEKKSVSRIADSIETALAESETVLIRFGKQEPLFFKKGLACGKCGEVFPKPVPAMFSFNSPHGACEKCNGFGNRLEIDRALVIPDDSKTLRGGAVEPFTHRSYRFAGKKLIELAEKNSINPDTPFSELSEKQKDFIFSGDGKEGVASGGILGFFKKIERKIYKVQTRVFLSRYRSAVRCGACGGGRIRREATRVKIGGRSISEVCEMTAGEIAEFFTESSIAKILSENEIKIAKDVLKEIRGRAGFLNDVGLEYLTLSRLTRTLSGGESQRAALASQLGSGLTETLYVLDEPSVGLHPRDTRNMVSIIKKIKKKGNTLIVVEHDLDIIKQADRIVELGPETGENGGGLIYQGPAKKLAERAPNSHTGLYLSGKKKIAAPQRKNKISKQNSLKIIGASENNLKKIDVSIPLGALVCVTGVSGSGKSSLIKNVLYSAIANKVCGQSNSPRNFRDIKGTEKIRGAVMLDQSPIGKNSRSNPATYVKFYDGVRSLMASSEDAAAGGFAPGDFSFNLPGGRCEVCEGEGIQKIEMLFLADVSVVCPECEGKRFRKKILDCKLRGKNIDDVLNLTVSEAAEFFSGSAAITKKLKLLDEVGLGYLRIGQSAATLSGGEAQRIKIVRELSKKHSGGILYILDEPSIGLHIEDVRKLLAVIEKLISAGNSAVVIEHNLEIIKTAAHIIDLGPGGGKNGGEIVAEGTPREVARCEKSATGKFLREHLN